MTALIETPLYSSNGKAAPDLGDHGQPCRTHPEPDLWFAESDSRALTLEQIEAKRLCGTCPVQSACLLAAYQNDEKWGIWGGLTPTERNTAKPREKGAPRPRNPIRHGTEAGYKQHQRRHEKPCDPCREASNRAKRDRERRGGAAA